MNIITCWIKRWLDNTEPPMHDPDNMSGAQG